MTGRHKVGLKFHLGAEMVRSHQVQRLAADDPVTVEHAAVQQHLTEARVIHRGRDQPAAARFHHRFVEHVKELHLVAVPGIGRKRLGETVRVFAGGVKRGLGHLQRRQNSLGQERAQRFSADDFDDAPKNVGGAAVVPFRAGLAHQRQARHQRRVLGIADLAAAQP